MSQQLVAIDAGTTGVTAILFDADLRPVRKAYREFPQGFPRPGWVEHEARDVLGAVDATLEELFGSGPTGEVAGVGITNQRETVFALDVEERRALGAGIVWQDRRTAGRCAQLRAEGWEPRVRARTGLVLDPYFSATKVEWLLQHGDGVRAAAAAGRVRFCTVDALIVHHLTGSERCATDATNASRTMLFDIQERRWSEELCSLFGVEPDWLPRSARLVRRLRDGASPRRSDGSHPRRRR